MKKLIRFTAMLGAAYAMLSNSPVFAATNQATNATGGGVTLADSANVTVNAASLALVKAVFDNSGNCLASSNSDATCNSGVSSVTVPSGTTIKFLIYVKNLSDITIPDVRFQDLVTDTAGAAGGFTYTANSMKTTAVPTDVDTLATIYTDANTGMAQTDAVDTGGTNYASINTAASPDLLTVGAHATQTNASLSIAAHKTFAIIFTVTKN